MKRDHLIAALYCAVIISLFALTVGKPYAIFSSDLPSWAKWMML